MSNPFDIVDSEVSNYIKHDYQNGGWKVGDEQIDANYFQVDTATIKMGWGKYDAASGYTYVFQDDLHKPIPKPDEDFKKVDEEFFNSLSKLNGQALHAETLGFMHPTKKKWVSFEAKLPNDFKKILDLLKKLSS